MKSALKVDRRRLDAMLRAVDRAPSYRIGIIGDEARMTAKGSLGTAEELSVAEVAAMHELGIGVPQRSWLLGWSSEKRSEADKIVQQAFKRWAVDVAVPLNNALEGAMMLLVASIRRRIRAGIAPPLEESTKARKKTSSGSKDTPLIDTGQLVAAITYAEITE